MYSLNTVSSPFISPVAPVDVGKNHIPDSNGSGSAIVSHWKSLPLPTNQTVSAIHFQPVWQNVI